jgi:hypothetical protein
MLSLSSQALRLLDEARQRHVTLANHRVFWKAAETDPWLISLDHAPTQWMLRGEDKAWICVHEWGGFEPSPLDPSRWWERVARADVTNGDIIGNQESSAALAAIGSSDAQYKYSFRLVGVEFEAVTPSPHAAIANPTAAPDSPKRGVHTKRVNSEFSVTSGSGSGSEAWCEKGVEGLRARDDAREQDLLQRYSNGSVDPHSASCGNQTNRAPGLNLTAVADDEKSAENISGSGFDAVGSQGPHLLAVPERASCASPVIGWSVARFMRLDFTVGQRAAISRQPERPSSLP